MFALFVLVIWAVSPLAPAGAAKLSGRIEQRCEEHAGAVRFQQVNDVTLDPLRLRVAGALEGK